jgi:hypothetical protein
MNPMHGRFTELYKGTPAELALEPAVAALGVPYRTNFPCYLHEGGVQSFPDFVLPSLGLVIEVDGPEHHTPEGVERDIARSRALFLAYGWRTLRCDNSAALREPYETVARLLKMVGLELPLSPAQALGLPNARRGKPPTRRGRAQSTRGGSGAARTRKARTPAKRARAASGQPKSPRKLRPATSPKPRRPRKAPAPSSSTTLDPSTAN